MAVIIVSTSTSNARLHMDTKPDAMSREPCREVLASLENLSKGEAPDKCFGSTGTLLKFDSVLCGFPVGRIVVSSAENLVADLTAAREQGIALLFGTCQSDHAAAANGGLLVDQRTQLSLKLTPSIIDAAQRTKLPDNIYIQEWTGAPTEALESIARQAGEHSRYYIDPCLADHVGPTLFTAWLRNLCAGRLHSKALLSTTNHTMPNLNSTLALTLTLTLTLNPTPKSGPEPTWS